MAALPLADWLRSLSDDALAALLRSRRDLATPPPANSDVLATRAGTAGSIARACENLDSATLAVLEVLLIAGADEHPVDTGRLDDLLGTPPPGALDRLRTLALAWGPDEAMSVPPAARDVFGPFPAGLGTSSPELAALGSDGLLERLRELGEDERALLTTLSSGPPIGRTRDAATDLPLEAATTPVQDLLARGPLVRRADRTGELPRAVASALPGGGTSTRSGDRAAWWCRVRSRGAHRAGPAHRPSAAIHGGYHRGRGGHGIPPVHRSAAADVVGATVTGAEVGWTRYPRAAQAHPGSRCRRTHRRVAGGTGRGGWTRRHRRKHLAGMGPHHAHRLLVVLTPVGALARPRPGMARPSPHARPRRRQGRQGQGDRAVVGGSSTSPGPHAAPSGAEHARRASGGVRDQKRRRARRAAGLARPAEGWSTAGPTGTRHDGRGHRVGRRRSGRADHGRQDAAGGRPARGRGRDGRRHAPTR